MSTETTNTAPSTEQPPVYSGDSEGVHAAAEEIRRKRGDEGVADVAIGNGADDVQGPAADEPSLRLSDAAKQVVDWRAERAAAREKFERAVFGEQASDEEAARLDGIPNAQDLAQQIAQHDSAAAQQQAQVQQQAPAPEPAPLT